MDFKYGVAGMLLSAALTMPPAAQADRDRNESGQGNCYEHKGKMKCKGQERGNGNHRENFRSERGYEYEGEGNHHSSAGGPPPWAPAHGWRRKQDGSHEEVAHAKPVVMEHDGTHVTVRNGAATVDVGINRNTCNRDAIGTVIGGIIGGAIGNRVGDRDQREVATVLGVVIGGVVGHEVGRSMDKADQHCTGQVLEQASDNQTVHWADHNNSGQYSVTPTRTYQMDGKDCRDYITKYKGTSGTQQESSSACRTSDGSWSKLSSM